MYDFSRNIVNKYELDNKLVQTFLYNTNQCISKYEIWMEVNNELHANIIPNRYFVSTFGRVYDDKRKILMNQYIEPVAIME